MQSAKVVEAITSSVKKGFIYANKGDIVQVLKAEGDLYLIQTQTTKIYTQKKNIELIKKK